VGKKQLLAWMPHTIGGVYHAVAFHERTNFGKKPKPKAQEE